MKYKLINKVTNEETICEKAIANGFECYISNEENKKFNSSYKVIATNNPSDDLPQVIDEVDKLLEGWERNVALGIGIGYNKSQTTHPFSENDMVDFNKWTYTSKEAMYYKDKLIFCEVNYELLSKELLKIWKSQQIKTIYY